MTILVIITASLTEGRRVGWDTHRHSWLPLSEEPSQISVNMLSQISAILGGLEGHILRRKRKIYESVTSSIQNDLKPCYEGGPQGSTSSSWFSGIPFPINFLLCWQLSKNPSIPPEFLYCSQPRCWDSRRMQGKELRGLSVYKLQPLVCSLGHRVHLCLL